MKGITVSLTDENGTDSIVWCLSSSNKIKEAQFIEIIMDHFKSLAEDAFKKKESEHLEVNIACCDLNIIITDIEEVIALK